MQFPVSGFKMDDENVGRLLQEGEAPEIAEVKYEYLDHTADVQLHTWGDNLQEAFEQIATAMFNYMTTDYDTVEMLSVHEIEAEGEDMMSLLFHFLDEFLFLFSAEPYIIPRVVKITEFDVENFRIKAEGYGESFDISKHPQGTEVKAITYSNMQIHDKEGQHELFVIIDI
ncbi:protein archease-like [Haliotis cracherodii]|uniref:protein archease-like n=1 Tax=Haliotis cracherodii TaxID=6455 RepID=UPI0039EAF5A3